MGPLFLTGLLWLEPISFALVLGRTNDRATLAFSTAVLRTMLLLELILPSVSTTISETVRQPEVLDSVRRPPPPAMILDEYLMVCLNSCPVAVCVRNVRRWRVAHGAENSLMLELR